MPENDLLDGTVEEAKEQLRDMENPDYSEYLEEEKNGKNRKTLTSWLENRIEENEEESSAEDDMDEDSVEEELEQIEEDTSSSMFGSTSKEAVGIAGVLLGIVLGLTTGLGASEIVGPDSLASDSQVTSDVESILDSERVDNLEIQDPVMRNGMIYVNATGTVTSRNTTRTVTQGYYVSPDGKLLFPERQSPVRNVPINIEEQLQNRQDNEENTTQR